jgi:hypothetical protein
MMRRRAKKIIAARRARQDKRWANVVLEKRIQ